MSEELSHPERHVIASKLLSSANSELNRNLRVDVFAPFEGACGYWHCRYEFIVDGVPDRESVVQGVDGVDAIVAAFWHIEIDLALKDRYKMLEVQSDSPEGLGFVHSPRVWKSIYGLSE